MSVDIERYLQINDKYDKNIIESNINFLTIQNYGHYILNYFGSEYFYELEKIIFSKYIKNITEDEFRKIATYHLITQYKDLIIERFGIEYYNTFSLIFTI